MNKHEVYINWSLQALPATKECVVKAVMYQHKETLIHAHSQGQFTNRWSDTIGHCRRTHTHLLVSKFIQPIKLPHAASTWRKANKQRERHLHVWDQSAKDRKVLIPWITTELVNHACSKVGHLCKKKSEMVSKWKKQWQATTFPWIKLRVFVIFCKNYNPASEPGDKRGGGGFCLKEAFGYLCLHCAYILRYSSDQGVCKKVATESAFLVHPVSEVLWMTTICKKVPLVWDNAMKHMKYAVVMATRSTTTTTADSTAVSLSPTSNKLCDDIFEQSLTSEPQASIGDLASLVLFSSNVPPASIWRRKRLL